MNASGALVAACRGTLALARTGPVTRHRVYDFVYAGGFDGTGLPQYRLPGVRIDTWFVQHLSLAGGSTTNSDGWSVTSIDRDRVLLDIDGVRAWADRSLMRSEPVVGDNVRIEVPHIRRGRLPGFVERVAVVDLSGLVSRIYLNIGPHQARWVLHGATRVLEQSGLPCQAKVPGHPSAYYRRDAGVLYVNSADEEAAVRILGLALDNNGIRLAAPTPLLTDEVRPGFAIADEPSDQYPEPGRPISHGQWVCGILVEAAQRCESPTSMADMVLDLVAGCGRDPAQPYRRAPRPQAPDGAL